ncbi:hypothetical protein V495_05209 [Pseudogymnoascus sp. VKM F-4514 (FW-929)]|nr:hypothetical protein V495_05209 [Pseudogymnoascus sp. VKM F-4514 (FW-929)]KFY61336.1 hypothetical protein V497_03016 [Pseudogymnoascus sp. VKM F-4516 (FW-969)]
MADPFSIVAGAIGIIDVCVKVGVYLRDVQNASGGVEEELTGLAQEIEGLLSVNEAIKEVSRKEESLFSNYKFADQQNLRGLWQHAGQLQYGCKKDLDMFERLLMNIIGPHGPKTSDQAGLQTLLSVLNLCYTRISFESNDNSLAQLSDDINLLDYKLQAQLSSLRPKLVLTENSQLCDSIGLVIRPLLSLNVHFDIPHAVNSLFTGRDEYLQDLRKSLDDTMTANTSTQKRFVVYGLGGSGKTEFCCKFAQDNRQLFWGVFWVDASSDQNAKHSFKSIAKIGGVEPNERAAMRWLSSLSRPWLLLIDNADAPSMRVEDYFPPGEQGFILITTRNPQNRYLATIGSQEFDRMQDDEAIDLLLKASNIAEPWSCTVRQQAAPITEALGYLPLALISAGTAVSERLCTLEDYIPYLKRSCERIREQMSILGTRKDDDDESTMHVYSSYEIIYLSLEAKKNQTSRDAIELLRVFSFLHYENIRVKFMTPAATNPGLELEEQKNQSSEEEPLRRKPWSRQLKDFLFGFLEIVFRDRGRPVLPTVLRSAGLTPEFDIDRLNLALRILSQLSMITYHEKTDSYSMHPLIHTWVRERPQNKIGEQAIWYEAAITTLAQRVLIPPFGTSEEDEEMKRDLLPHVDQARTFQKEIALKIIARQVKRKWIIPVAPPVVNRQKIIQAVKFSLVYEQSGKWEEAERLQLMVKDYLCAKLGTEHPLSMKIMLALSGIYWQQTRAKEAAELQSQVLKSCVNSLGLKHPKTLKAMDTLGATRCLQGRFKESHELHEKAIEGMTEILGAKHENTLLAMNNFGRIKWMYFQFEEAKFWYLKAVAGMKEVLGEHHLETLIAIENLSITYIDLGGSYLQIAHDQMEMILKTRREKLGKEAPWTLVAICNLARAKSALGNMTEAEEMLGAAIPIAERDLGKDHFGTLAGKVHYAQILVRLGRYDEAEDMFTGVIERQRYHSAARDDGEHPDRILAMNYLLECYQRHGKIDKSIEICEELADVVQTIGGQGLGKQHAFAKRLSKKHEELLELRAKSSRSSSS